MAVTSALQNTLHGHLRLVAMVRVKDEEWILEPWLKRTCEIADGIIALDDGSTDNSVDILKSCPKVIEILHNPPGGPWNCLRDRNRLLDVARSKGAAWAMVIDPDEIMDVRLAAHLDELLGQGEVGSIVFKEVTLWRSCHFYRVDKPHMYGRVAGTNAIVRMTPRLRWVIDSRFSWKRRALTFLATGRLPPAPVSGYETLRGIQGCNLKVPDLVRSHYHFVEWERVWRIHMRYAVRDAIQMRRRLCELPEVVKWATARMDETGLELAPVKREWGVIEIDKDRKGSVGCTSGSLEAASVSIV